MKRLLGMVLAGLVGVGTLFTGVGVAYAEEEELVEEQKNEVQDHVIINYNIFKYVRL